MGSFRNPKTKQVVTLPDRFDTETGKDVNREIMIKKGYEVVTKLYNPSKTKEFVIPDRNDLIDAAVAKGWKRETDFIEPTKATTTQSGTVAKHEVEQIAKKYGVPFEELDRRMEFYGADPNYRPVNVTRDVIGTAGRVVGSNVPQFIDREIRDEKTQQAFSDLQELARERQSTARFGTELVGGVLAPGGVAFKIGKTFGATAKSASAVAASGAAFGAAGSAEGEEVQGAVTGAGLSLGLGVIGATLSGRVLSKADEKKIVDGIEAKTGKNVEGIISEVRTKRADIIDARKAATVGEATPEQLKVLGNRVVAKPNLKQDLSNLDDVQKESKLLELGQVDADHQTLKLAKELGWEGSDAPLPRMVKTAKTDRYPSIQKQVDSAKEFIQKQRAAPGGEVAVEQAFNKMVDVNILSAVMKKVPDITESHAKLRGILESIIDGKYVARGIDRRLGSNVEGVIQKLDGATNQHAYIVTSKFDEISAVEKAIIKVGLDVEDFRKYVESPQQRALLNPEQQAVVKQTEDFFEAVRADVESMGFKIDKRENYFPHATPDLVESTLRLKARIKQFKEKTGVDILDATGMDNVALAKLRQVDPDLLKAIQITNNTIIKTGDDLVRQARMAITPGVGKKPKQMTEASAAFMRNEGMPEFMLNNNFKSAALNWVQETYRHVLVKDHLAALQRYRDLAYTAKDTRAGDYLDGLLDDLTGIRQNTVASNVKKLTASWQIKFAELAEEAKNPVTKTWYSMARDVPELMPTLLSQAYPNFLGLSPRSALMNLSQLGTMTMPELGIPLFMRHSLGSILDLVLLKKTGMEITINSPTVAKSLNGKIGDKARIFDINTYLTNEGLLSQPYSQELVDALTNNARTSLPVKVFKKIANTYSKYAMLVFSATEAVNRGVVAGIGRGVARDLLAKNSLATDWLQRVEGAQRKKIWDLMQKGDAKALERTVQEYLISKSIFNYTRQSMSNYGRFMGPAFSMFTKWPSSIAGEVVEQYSANTFNKASLELIKRYLAPAGALFLLSQALDEMFPDSPEVDALTGTRGLSSWAPVTALSSISSGDIFQSPALSIASDTVNGLLNLGDPNKLVKALDNAAMTTVPGMGIWRFLSNEGSGLFLGEEPTRPKPVSTILEATGIKEPKDVK